MVKILLKKQLVEMYKSYFYNAKKGIARSKGAVILRFALFAVLILGGCGGLFGVISYLLCEPFCALDLGWLYFVIMGLISIALGSFGSVFNTYAGLYLAKDNDLLLSMPIPVSAIMAARLLGVYLMGLLYSGLVSLGAVVVYLIISGFSIGAFLGGLLYVFFISLVVLILSCLLGWVVAKISVKLKNKSFITVIVSLAGISLYYFCYFKAQTLLSELVQNATVYVQQVKSHAIFLYAFGRMAQGYWLDIAACMASVALAFALTWLVLKRSFVHVATGGDEVVVSHKAEQKDLSIKKTKSLHSALLSREFARFRSSASYMLNCGLGTLILLLFAIAMVVKASYVQNMLEQFAVSGNALVVLGACAICLVASTNDMATASVSLEGKNIWILQSLPVQAWDVLKAKLSVQILLTAPFAILCVLAMAFALDFGIIQLFVVLALVVGFVFFMALFDLTIGLKMPNLTWTNELTPIKQSLAVFIAIFGGWLYIGIIIGIYFLVASSLNDTLGTMGDILYLGIFTVLIWLVSAFLAYWLKKKGSAVFERL